MKIRFERTTTIVEVGYVEIADTGPGVAEYVKAAKRGLRPPLSLNPWPAKWEETSRRQVTRGQEDAHQP